MLSDDIKDIISNLRDVQERADELSDMEEAAENISIPLEEVPDKLDELETWEQTFGWRDAEQVEGYYDLGRDLEDTARDLGTTPDEILSRLKKLDTPKHETSLVTDLTEVKKLAAVLRNPNLGRLLAWVQVQLADRNIQVLLEETTSQVKTHKNKAGK